MTPAQGEIWWAETEERKRRPVLVVTRTPAASVLRRVVVAPITRTVRTIPTEIALDEAEGLAGPSAASFDNLQPIPRALLTERICALSGGHAKICRALAALADC